MEDQKTSRGHPPRRGRTSREVCSRGDPGPLVVSWDTCAPATRLTGHRSPPPSLYHFSLLFRHVLNPAIPCRGWILSRCLQSIFTYILTRVDWVSVMRKVGCWNPEMQRWTEQSRWVTPLCRHHRHNSRPLSAFVVQTLWRCGHRWTRSWIFLKLGRQDQPDKWKERMVPNRSFWTFP